MCGAVYVCMHLSAQSPEQLACLHAVSMPAKRRLKCTLTEQLACQLLKAHVSSLEGEEFLSTDLEDVAARYAGLLAALAQHTSRVNTSVLQSAAVAIFACTPAAAKAFAEAMKNTMAMCVQKALKATSGKKLSAAVRAVCLAMADPRLTHLQAPYYIYIYIPKVSREYECCDFIHQQLYDYVWMPLQKPAGAAHQGARRRCTCR